MPKVPYTTGIYQIKNLVNGKIYIGSAASSFKIRWYNHKAELKGNRHFNQYLQRSWNKHGAEKFEFTVIEMCPPLKCLEREQYWLDLLTPWNQTMGYNISKVAGSAMQGRNHSEESCLKMSVARKGIIPSEAARTAATLAIKGKPRPQEVRDKIAKSNEGKVLTEEHKANVKANHWTKRADAAEIRERSASKQRGRKHSEEHKLKISEGNYRRWQKYREENG